MEYCVFLDWSVNSCRFAPALSFLSSFDLTWRNGPGCLHTAGKRSLLGTQTVF